MGLDPLLMLAKRIPDIRLLRSDDPRIARQMLDLDRYQPVSPMSAITRDLSVAASADDDQETPVKSATGYPLLPASRPSASGPGQAR